METEEPFKIGFLFTPPQTFLRRTWSKRFCALFKASSFGIQRLEVFDNDGAFLKQSKSPSKIIALTDCVKVTPAPQKQQANVFEVRTKSSCHQFSADSFQEMADWLSALQTVAFGVNRPSSGMGIAPVIQNVKQEENLLYSSMDEPELYSVKALNTDAMLRNNLYGDYTLIVTSVNIAIAEENVQKKVGRTILTWPYRHIRRYGCSKDNFSFEAGRKCISGEGLFAFGTLDGSLIFQSVDNHVSSLKTSQSDTDAPSSPFLDDEKNSYVFSFKEALLVSKDKNLHNINSSASKIPSHNNVFETTVEPERSIVKPAISKPPRKSKQSPYTNFQVDIDGNKMLIASKGDTNFSSNVYAEPLNKYDNHIEACSSASIKDKSKEFIVEKVDSNVKYEQDSDSVTSCEPIYAVLEENAVESSDWKMLGEQFSHITVSNKHFDKNELVLARRYSDQESDSYDHLSLKKFDCSRTYPTGQASDHIYGKLLPTKPNSSVSKSQPKSAYGSLKTQRNDGKLKGNPCVMEHSYINVQIPKPVPTSLSQENAITPSNNEPKHFLLNNAEYAKVFKGKK